MVDFHAHMYLCTAVSQLSLVRYGLILSMYPLLVYRYSSACRTFLFRNECHGRIDHVFIYTTVCFLLVREHR